eukprot:CAMPEP_0115036308 /NCGR_PEP_ID=MMETSP0216-20121206/42038_1 /TAXON_ID=223996 /ORGANISM="Protocruzia adherens, Strain Boccale" /LENGTH=177 /DNA_ID=CAMNT_0002416097 /DNA_START=20 /DNA_END=550 /DNA_ORIENTATION=+
MGFLHLFNCALLAYGPLYVVYKATSLAEFGSIKVFIRAALTFAFAAVAKMILLATLIPFADDSEFNLLPEILKACISVVDIIGLDITLRSKLVSGPSSVKILSVGLGWAATANAVLSNLLTLALNATSSEFTWDYILLAVSANIITLNIFSLAALVWLMRRASSGLIAVMMAINIIV